MKNFDFYSMKYRSSKAADLFYKKQSAAFFVEMEKMKQIYIKKGWYENEWDQQYRTFFKSNGK